MEFPLGKAVGVAYQDDAIPGDVCDDLVKFINKRPHLHRVGITVGGHMPDTKHCIDVYITPLNEQAKKKDIKKLKEFEDVLFNSFTKVLTEYCDNYAYLGEWTQRVDTGYQYQRYIKGEGFYKTHIDGGAFLPPPSDRRVLAAIFYFNTIEVGGGTYFDLHDYTCDAVRGRIAIFPAGFNYPHGGLVPESEDKHIVSTFICAPVDTHS
jgi:hypothetical protein